MATKEEHFIKCMGEYRAKGVKIKAKLHWIKESDEPSNIYFDFLKRKNASERIMDLKHPNGVLIKGLTKIEEMFRVHFQNIFVEYPITE